jgi:aspartate racemase
LVSEPADAPTLGIVGGAGVGAAARLYSDVAMRVREASGALPQIVLWNLPFSDALEQAFVGGGPDGDAAMEAERLVAQAIDRLLDAGATVIAMPCNSLQAVAARHAQRRSVPFIDMIVATVAAVRAASHRSAVLLATDATQAAGIYEGHGVEILAPPSELRPELAALIVRAVEGPPPGAAELGRLVERARRPQASVVLGCTDICGLLESEDADVVDSLACLVGSCADALGVPASVAAPGDS